MIDKTYDSLLELVIIAIAVLLVKYIFKATNTSRLLCGTMVLGILGLYVYILTGAGSLLPYLDQFAMFYENVVIAGYGRYISTLIFTICLLNSVGFGRKD